ncbi:MAG: twin-arginine translocation signal domain-containing protein [Chloroflexi bacterium]|nr:MAG: twin-arginine translocation signal domain-containing protein [Chloroflexota bacterium]
MLRNTKTSRRAFLKGAGGAVGAAALTGNFGLTDAIRTLANDTDTVRVQGDVPQNKMSAVLPETSNEIVLRTPHIVKEIAPNTPYEVWTFNDTGPGTHLHVRQGETVNFTLVNDGPMPHSIDFHAAQVPWDRYYQSVAPGESLSFEWTPNFPGAYMYHCGTPPVLLHIANGMHGAIIVQPEGGWPEPAREYVIVQHEWYVGEADADGVHRGDFQKMLRAQPDFVAFNGYPNQYQDEPLVADPGELIRIHVVNCGPSLWSAFHVIGALFEAVYPNGTPANRQEVAQTVSIPPGSGYTVELRIPDEGLYPFVTHNFAYTGIGALGILQIGNP